MNPFLVTQLRNAHDNGPLCREAANEIERLTAALHALSGSLKYTELSAGVRLGNEIHLQARARLAAEADADRLYEVLVDCVAPYLADTEQVIEAKLKHDDAVLFRGAARE